MPSELIHTDDLGFVVMNDDLKEYMVDAIDADIIRRFGPHYDMGQNEFWSWTRFYGRESPVMLYVPFRVASIVSIQESEAGGTLATVDSGDYEIVSEHRVYRTSGTWDDVGAVTYIPVNDDAIRLQVLIQCLQLAAQYNGADDETIGSYTISNPEYRRKYERIMTQMRPWVSV